MTDPTDETQPTPAPADPAATPPPEPAQPPPVVPGPTPPPWPAQVDPPAPTDPGVDPPPLRAKPDRPADPGWREPPWIPARPRDRRPSTVALIVGLALIVIGIWLFVDRTLGIALPNIAWRSLWPLALIVVGALVLIRSLDRRT
jgi:hypothetical protein